METIVSKDSMSSSDILNLFPGVESNDILTKTTNNVLNNDNDISFLDKQPGDKDKDTFDGQDDADKDKDKDKDAPAPIKPVNQTEADKILDSTNLDDNAEDTEEGAEGDEGKGRPKTDKSALTSYLKGKIEAKEFAAFSDFDEKKETLDEYLKRQPEKVLHELLDMNWQEREKEVLANTPKEFFEALPPELQYAARYAMAGGKDFKNLFAAMSRVEETKSLDPTTEDGQIAIARTYLRTIDYGSDEAIEDEIDTWKKTGKLEKKIGEFKPKLDAMQKEQVEHQIQQEEEWKQQRTAAAQAYMGNVHKALEKGEINNIKLDRKTQAMLFQGLTNVSYPSASGRPTNLLGHLLDKIQYQEPNFELLAEVTYLLSDPEGYRSSIKQLGKNDAVNDTVRKLKTEKMHDQAASEPDDKGEDKSQFKKKIAKPSNILSGWSK